MRILRTTVGVLLAIVGIGFLIRLFVAISRTIEFTSYELGGLSASLFMAVLAFALAWRCLKKRKQ
jgi:hypothetical protein